MEKLSALCPDCGVTEAIIDKQSFSCYPESPSYVTYRARLEGTYETESGHLISLIEQWIVDGAGVIVNEVLMKVDPKCSVVISGLSEEECIPIPSPSMEVNNGPAVSGQDQSSTLPTTIGVIVVVVVLIIATTIIIVIIALLVSRNRQADYSLKNSSAAYVKFMHYQTILLTLCTLHTVTFCSYIPSHRNGSKEKGGDAIKTSSNEAYEDMKQGGGEAYEIMDITPTVTTPTPAAPVDQEGMYEIPSASSQPLPAIPPEEAKEKEEDDGVYETIPGDK